MTFSVLDGFHVIVVAIHIHALLTACLNQVIGVVREYVLFQTSSITATAKVV
jgi:hypothetical protein